MSEKRRALGRGLGALIPNSPAVDGGSRPVDVFFKDQRPTAVLDEASSVVPSNGNGSDNGHAGGPGSMEDVAAPEAGPAQDLAQADHGAVDVAEQVDAMRPADGIGEEGAPEALAGTGSADGLAPVPGATYGEIPLEEIRPNPRQPRSVFDEDDMAELVYSIREIGVLQPVVVRPVDGNGDGIRYELIMGERRWRASKEAGQDSIPAIVKSTDDDDLLRDALLENLHRSELNALEEAAAYQQLLEDFGCTHDQLAGRIGRSRPQISNTLRLLRLPPLVARRVAAGVLSAGHARALLALEDGAAMERLAQRIVAEGLSVRTVEEIVALGGDDGEKAKPRRPRAGNRHPQLDDLAARLSDRFDTRVNITLGQRKGKLTVEFASVDDLHRIVDLLGVNPRG